MYVENKIVLLATIFILWLEEMLDKLNNLESFQNVFNSH